MAVGTQIQDLMQNHPDAEKAEFEGSNFGMSPLLREHAGREAVRPVSPRKGTIGVGSNADLVVYDPAYRGKISARTHFLNLDYRAFEGWEIKGRPHVVTVRGEVRAKDSAFVGCPIALNPAPAIPFV